MLSDAYDTVDHTLSFLLVQDYIERFFTYNVIEGLAPSGKERSRGFLQWTSIASRGSSFALSLSMLLKPCKLAPEALRVSLL